MPIVKGQVSACIFCKIVSKEIPSAIMYEGENIIAFKDIKPSAPTHILVVPKEHIESVSHLKPNHENMVGELVMVAKDLAAKLDLEGYKLVFNVGREGGQIIDHLHLHLLGGWSKSEDIDSMPHPSLDK